MISVAEEPTAAEFAHDPISPSMSSLFVAPLRTEEASHSKAGFDGLSPNGLLGRLKTKFRRSIKSGESDTESSDVSPERPSADRR